MIDQKEMADDPDGPQIPYGQLRPIDYDPNSRVAIGLVGRLTCICPYNGLRDHATVEVSYVPTGRLIELSSFARYLSRFSEERISHEEVTERIRFAVSSVTEADDVTVRSRWDPVEGIECTVSSS